MRALRRLTAAALLAALIVTAVPLTGLGATESSKEPPPELAPQGVVPQLTAPAATRESGQAGLERLQGPTRYETAAAISKETYPQGSDTVVLATGLNFPDALSGGPLASVLDAPLLLVTTHEVPWAVRNEIERLDATEAVILGGTGVVSAAVEAQLRSAGIEEIRRFGGADRYETSAMIADEVAIHADDEPSTAVVATGLNFPDAVAVAPYAAWAQIPILLARTDSVPDRIARALGELGLDKTIIVGGPAAISDGVEEDLPNPVRLAGANRYETAKAIAEYGCQHGLWFTDTLVATGQDFPDALTAGPLGAVLGAPLVLTAPTTPAFPAQQFLRAHRASVHTIWLIGGPAAVAEGVGNTLRADTKVEIPDGTVVLDYETRSKMESVSSNKVTFSGSTSLLSSLSRNDIIVSEPTYEAPDGLLRKVTNVSTSGGKVIVSTSGATIEDALGSSSADLVGTLSPYMVQSQSALDGVELNLGAPGSVSPDSLGTFDVSINNVVLYDSGGAKIVANGSVEFESDLIFNVSTSWLSLESALFKLETTERANLDITASTTVASLSKEVTLATYWLTPVTIQAGPVPVVITPVVTVNVGVNGKISLGISAGATQTMRFGAGVKYENGSWGPVSEFENSFKFNPPSASATASFKLYAGPQIDLLIYGVVGPTGELTAYLQLLAGADRTPPWELNAGLQCKIGVTFTLFKFAEAGYEATVIDWKHQLATGGKGTVTGVVTGAATGGPLNDVNVTVRRNGQVVGTGKTGPDGRYTIGSLTPGSGYSVSLDRIGHVPYSEDGITLSAGGIKTMNAVLVPLTAPDSLRVVLTWGYDPRDLDSHLTGPAPDGGRFHVYFGDREYFHDGLLYADLDVDDTTSYGPETTTIRRRVGGTYRFSVHDYSNKSYSYSTALANSGAIVRVYSAAGLAGTFRVPNRPGTLWTVFEWSGSSLNRIDAMSYESSASEVSGVRHAVQ
jgi:putative cell wall-binding protein